MLKEIAVIGGVIILYCFLKRHMKHVYAKRDHQGEYYDAKMRCQRRYPRIRFEQFKAWYEVNPSSWDTTRLKSHTIVTKDGDADMTYSMRYKDYAATLEWLEEVEETEWEFYSYGKLAKSVSNDVYKAKKTSQEEVANAVRTYEEVLERMREE